MKRLSIKLLYLAAIIILSGFAACLSCRAYYINSDLDDFFKYGSRLIVFVTLAGVFLATGAIVVCGSVIFGSKRGSTRTIVWFIGAIVIISVSYMVGVMQWQYEFYRNRGQAEYLIMAINDYYRTHGQYPADLTEVADPDKRVLRTFGKTRFVEYSRSELGSPELYYQYGWYTYRYRFESKEWSRSD